MGTLTMSPWELFEGEFGQIKDPRKPGQLVKKSGSSSQCLCRGLQMVLGQVATEEKSIEMTAIPELLHMLSIQGCVISIDAMGTQKAIATQIIEGGGYGLHWRLDMYFKEDLDRKRIKNVSANFSTIRKMVQSLLINYKTKKKPVSIENGN